MGGLVGGVDTGGVGFSEDELERSHGPGFFEAAIAKGLIMLYESSGDFIILAFAQVLPFLPHPGSPASFHMAWIFWRRR